MAASLHSHAAAPAHPCKRYTPALKGFVCTALLRCSWHGNSLHPQPVALAAASLHSQPAASRSSLQAPHTSPKGLRYRCSASLARARQQPAFAAGCIFRFAQLLSSFGGRSLIGSRSMAPGCTAPLCFMLLCHRRGLCLSKLGTSAAKMQWGFTLYIW